MTIVDDADRHSHTAVGEQAVGCRRNLHRHSRGVDCEGRAIRRLCRAARPPRRGCHGSLRAVGRRRGDGGRHRGYRHRVARGDATHTDGIGRERHRRIVAGE